VDACAGLEAACPKTEAVKTTTKTDGSITLAEFLINTRNLLQQQGHQYREIWPFPSFQKMLDSGMHSRVDTSLMKHESAGKTLRSGTLAKATGMSPDTIRHYERIGILPKALRTDSGYRVYPEDAIERVRVVQRALRIGFTLAELSDILRARDAGGAPCHQVYELTEEKLIAVQKDLKILRKTEKDLKKLLADWKVRIRKAGPGQKSHLLTTLTDVLGGSAKLSHRFQRREKP